MKLPHTLTHQVYALAVLYLYRLPLDSSGETKGCGWKRPLSRLASVWVHSEEGDGKSRSACFSLSSSVLRSQAGPIGTPPQRSRALSAAQHSARWRHCCQGWTALGEHCSWLKYKIAVYCQLNCFCFCFIKNSESPPRLSNNTWSPSTGLQWRPKWLEH